MNNLIYLFIPVFFLLHSCRNENKPAEKQDLPQEESGSLDNSGHETLKLTQKQISEADIKTGRIQKRLIQETIACNGVLEPKPEGYAKISPMMGGILEEIRIQKGETVEKGQTLAVLVHPDYIKLQQEYLQTKSERNYYEKEFKRQGELTIENAASIKTMQEAERNYLAMDAKHKALHAQLTLLGFDPEQVKHENFISSIELKAPISGYISEIQGHIGEYISGNHTLAEIIDKSQLAIRLNVYEKDISQLKKGQSVVFRLLDNEPRQYRGKITSGGLKVNPDEKKASVLAEFSGTNLSFIPGMYIDAEIITQQDSVYALPETSIIDEIDQQYIYMKEDTSFYQIPVKTGKVHNGLVHIISPLEELLNKSIVTEGTYYINAEMGSQE